MKNYRYLLAIFIYLASLSVSGNVSAMSSDPSLVAESTSGAKICTSDSQCPKDENNYTCSTDANNTQNTSNYKGYVMNVDGGDKPGTTRGRGVCVSKNQNSEDIKYEGCAKYGCLAGNMCVAGTNYGKPSSFCVLADFKAPLENTAPPPVPPAVTSGDYDEVIERKQDELDTRREERANLVLLVSRDLYPGDNSAEAIAGLDFEISGLERDIKTLKDNQVVYTTPTAQKTSFFGGLWQGIKNIFKSIWGKLTG